MVCDMVWMKIAKILARLLPVSSAICDGDIHQGISSFNCCPKLQGSATLPYILYNICQLHKAVNTLGIPTVCRKIN